MKEAVKHAVSRADLLAYPKSDLANWCISVLFEK